VTIALAGGDVDVGEVDPTGDRGGDIRWNALLLSVERSPSSRVHELLL